MNLIRMFLKYKNRKKSIPSFEISKSPFCDVKAKYF